MIYQVGVTRTYCFKKRAKLGEFSKNNYLIQIKQNQRHLLPPSNELTLSNVFLLFKIIDFGTFFMSNRHQYFDR